jgi:hypothetical protein
VLGAEAKVERELRRDAPVVLEIEGGVDVLLGVAAGAGDAAAGDSGQQRDELGAHGRGGAVVERPAGPGVAEKLRSGETSVGEAVAELAESIQ